MPSRFMSLADVAEELAISWSQAYALVRSGVLPAIKLGGRGQWRIEVVTLEAFIARRYAETRAFVREHPFTYEGGDDSDEDGGEAQGLN